MLVEMLHRAWPGWSFGACAVWGPLSAVRAVDRLLACASDSPSAEAVSQWATATVAMAPPSGREGDMLLVGKNGRRRVWVRGAAACDEAVCWSLQRAVGYMAASRAGREPLVLEVDPRHAAILSVYDKLFALRPSVSTRPLTSVTRQPGWRVRWRDGVAREGDPVPFFAGDAAMMGRP